MSWKKGLLPNAKFSDEVKTKVRRARGGNLRDRYALKESSTKEEQRGFAFLEMERLLGEITDKTIRESVRAALLSDETTSKNARSYLRGQATQSNASALAALEFLELRSQW